MIFIQFVFIHFSLCISQLLNHFWWSTFVQTYRRDHLHIEPDMFIYTLTVHFTSPVKCVYVCCVFLFSKFSYTKSNIEFSNSVL